MHGATIKKKDVNTVLEDKVTLYHKLPVCLHIVGLSCRMCVID